MDLDKFIASLIANSNGDNDPITVNSLKEAIADQDWCYSDGMLYLNTIKSEEPDSDKFRKGDVVVFEKPDSRFVDRPYYRIQYDVYRGLYIASDKSYSSNVSLSDIKDKIRLWDISRDAKDGDILSNESECMILFKGIREGLIDFYIGCTQGLTGNKLVLQNGESHWGMAEYSSLRPAFPYQINRFVKALKENGYDYLLKNPIDKLEEKSNQVVNTETVKSLTIDEIKNGDFLVFYNNDSKYIVIYDKEISTPYGPLLITYCSMEYGGDFAFTPKKLVCQLKNIRMATDEEKLLFLKKMNQSGYAWNAFENVLYRVDNTNYDAISTKVSSAGINETSIEFFEGGKKVSDFKLDRINLMRFKDQIDSYVNGLVFAKDEE